MPKDPAAPDTVVVDPVTSPTASPIENIASRQKAAATDAKQTLNTMTIVRDELRQAISRDEAEHKRLNDGLSSLQRQQQHTHAKVEALSTQLTELRVDSASLAGGLEGANGKLDLLVDDIQASKRASEHRERVTIETAAVVERTTIEDLADSKKVRRARNLKILTIVAGAFGTGGVVATAIAALVRSC